MTHLNDERYDAIVQMLTDWVGALEREGHAETPLFRSAGPAGEDYTPRRILQEVAARTDFGEEFVDSWVDLSMRHILHAKFTPPSSQSSSS
jgi:hypothetical protein